MTELTRLEELRMHECIEDKKNNFRRFITKVPKGLIYTFEFFDDYPHSSSVFVPFDTSVKFVQQDF